MNTPLKEKIVEKLDQVPEAALSEVVDFVDFLVWKAQQTEGARPVGFLPLEADPLIGLFSGAADLASHSETILQDEIHERSGWTWKQQHPS